MDNKFVKLKDLVGSTIKVDAIKSPKWRMWDAAASKFQWSNEKQKGMQKCYFLDTDKGMVTVSASQVGAMLEEALVGHTSVITGQRFSIASNGKEGKDIRYFFNRVEEQVEQVTTEDDELNEIPF